MLSGVWRTQWPWLMFATSRTRDSWGTEQIEDCKYLFSEGEDAGRGKCRWAEGILLRVILKGISSKRTAWKGHVTSIKGWTVWVQRLKEWPKQSAREVARDHLEVSSLKTLASKETSRRRVIVTVKPPQSWGTNARLQLHQLPKAVSFLPKLLSFEAPP